MKYPIDRGGALVQDDDYAPKKTYYHGTIANLQPGQFLRPGKELGFDNYGLIDNDGTGRNSHVYLGEQERTAWDWGGAGRGSALGATMPRDQHRATVYEVEPLGDVEPDGWVNGAYRVGAGARIKRRIDIPPATKYDQARGLGRQGDLPPYDWNDDRFTGFMQPKYKKQPQWDAATTQEREAASALNLPWDADLDTEPSEPPKKQGYRDVPLSGGQFGLDLLHMKNDPVGPKHTPHPFDKIENKQREIENKQREIW